MTDSLSQDRPNQFSLNPAAPAGSQKASWQATAAAVWRSHWVEWIVIFFVVLAFCSQFLFSAANQLLPGNESEIFQSLDWTLYHSIIGEHQFPLWNPYIKTGLPFVADPMMHSFNPLVTLPVLALGVTTGFKVGLFLSFLAAALGMWHLGSALGMGRAARLWIALLFVFAGQPIARFFQGQYLFVLGFAWIPWTISSLYLAIQTRRRLHIAFASASLALLFFSGNAYYSFYMLVAILILSLVSLPRFRRQKPYIAVEWTKVRVLAVVGLLSLGLVAIQLLPLAEFWPHIGKSTEVAGSHTLRQILLDFISTDSFRPDAYNTLGAREEYYAYIGLAPLLCLGLLPLALRKRDLRKYLIFGLLLAFTLVWIDLDRMPWRDWFMQTRLLTQFRHLLRILIYSSLAIIVLAGLGLDRLWKMLVETTHDRAGSPGWVKVQHIISITGSFLLGIFMLAGISDVYTVNRQHLITRTRGEPVYAAMSRLRQSDPSDFYVRFNPNNAGTDAVISNQLRFLDTWYHFADIRQRNGNFNRRPVQAQPNYLVQNQNAPLMDAPGAATIQVVQGYSIYQLPHSLPIAFTVNNSLLLMDSQAGELLRDNVTAQTPFFPGPNDIEVIASGTPDDSLVVLETAYQGWQVRIDDRPHSLRVVGGYLATNLLEGVHKYTFSYRPRSFFTGLGISLISFAIFLFLLVSDLRFDWRKALARLRGIPFSLRRSWQGRQERKDPSWQVTAATYQEGRLLPDQPLELGESARVRITIESDALEANPRRLALRRWWWATTALLESLVGKLSLETTLFVGALLFYLITRLYALDRFPIYFFGDEAVQVNFAQRLIASHFRDAKGALFPMYVEAAGLRWTPLLSMYVHALTLTLFGKSIFIARATSAVVSSLAAVSVALIMRNIFKARYWWVAALLLTVTPAWFLHSRTAFETVMTTAFYSCFLLCYLLYRTRSPRYIYAAIVFGAATFYSYSNAQLIIAAAAALLFISDFRYHLRQWRTLLPGIVLLAVLAWPLYIFRQSRPDAIAEHLRAIDTYWLHSIPLQEKISLYLQKYTYGLSPAYWFLPNDHDLARHRMAGIAHLPTLALPLLVIGVLVCLRNFRSSPHRAVIIAALATPVGAALLDIGIPRVLAFVVPATLLTAIGLEWLLSLLKKRLPQTLLALALFLVLGWSSFALLRTTLTKGPLWFSDYGLYGMQYGAKQIFEEAIPKYLKSDPATIVDVSSTWANGADTFLSFFYNREELKRVRMAGIEQYLFEKLPLSLNELFVMTASEYQKAASSPKFKTVRVDQVIPYPDGTPGFYLARVAYADNVDALFAAEKEARRQLVVDHVEIDGQSVEIHYSQTDMGLPKYMFDGDTFTLMRGLEANPFIIDLYFPQPRTISGLDGNFGLMDIAVTAKLYSDPAQSPIVYQGGRKNDNDRALIHLTFDQGSQQVSWLHLEIKNPSTGESANIHIMELKLLP